jgi:uncharacterized protein (TIGR03067 family)
MKNVGSWLARRRRGLLSILGAIGITGVSYLAAAVLHREALGQVAVAKGHIARSDWLAALESLDTAFRRDRYLPSEVYLLRATAINNAIHTTGKRPAGHTREDALADIDWFLQSQPNSGEAYYERGCALAGLAKIQPARDAFAQAISLLPDPTQALLEHAALSFHVSDYGTAEKQMSLAIARHPLIPEYYEQRALYRSFTHDFRGASLDKARAARLEEDPTGGTLAEVETLAREQDDQPIATPQNSEPVRAALAQLAGDWNVVIREANGVSRDTTNRTYSYRFHDGRYSVLLDGSRQPDSLIRVDPDPDHQRYRIDLIRANGGTTITLLGIYEFRDDTLRLCVANEGQPRPIKFTTDGPFGVTLYTMKPAGK